MESKHIEKVALPLDGPAFAAHFQANNGVEWAKRGVIAGRPFWVDEC